MIAAICATTEQWCFFPWFLVYWGALFVAFAEKEQFFSRAQFGNRSGRSVQGALFLSRTILELAAEVARNPALNQEDLSPLTVLLFDIQKALPWETLINVLRSLRAGTLYQVTTSQGLSQRYRLASGFREGCSTSPCLYILFHDYAMKDFARQARKVRRERPDNYVEVHSWGGRPLNKRMTRHT